MARLRAGVLISGRGSNLAALIEACRQPDYPAEIALVIANRPEAPGLAHARQAGLPCMALDHRAVADRAAFDAVIDGHLRNAGAELVCLAGYMRLLSQDFLARWHDRVINIHPSLLPAFRGMNAQAQALAAGVKLAGCTVHVVRHEVDSGPIIAQAAVPVLAEDTAERLAERILAAEHRLYPLALRLWAEGRVRIRGDVADIAGPIVGPGERPRATGRESETPIDRILLSGG